jgi:D-alanine transaminase
MERYVFFNGEFYPEKTPLLSVLDRGLCFGDGLFEVIRCIEGKFLLFSNHIERMQNSSAFLEIDFPYNNNDLLTAARELVKKNKIKDGELYVEITRGEAPRYHTFPEDTEPNFFMALNPLRVMPKNCWSQGIKVITYPDIRWKLCNIKSINLLPNVLAKQKAKKNGAYEVLMTEEDEKGSYITEGASSSYFSVKNNTLITPELDNILPGVTRFKVICIAQRLGIEVEEIRLYLGEFLNMDEVFLTSTVSKVMPVVAIDDVTIGDGNPGKITQKLQSEYEKYMMENLE